MIQRMTQRQRIAAAFWGTNALLLVAIALFTLA